MTKMISILIVSACLVGCQKPEQKVEQKAELAIASISIPTARCEMCAETITKALKDVKGVESASVDLDKKSVAVKFLATSADLHAMEKAIAKAGYDANSTKRDSAAYAALPECCQ